MPEPAYVVLSSVGVVQICHSRAIAGVPSNGSADLESLIAQGFQPVREVALDGSRVLLVLSKP